MFHSDNYQTAEQQLSAIRALLNAGANPNARDTRGRTPAHLLFTEKWPWDGVEDILSLLVRAGANLSTPDDQGKTPLHYLASLGGQNPMFFIRGIGDIFIAAKVNLNARDNDGDTPLHLAAKTGTTDVFDWLVQHGANLDATNNAGETPRLLMAHKINGFPRSGPPNAETDIFEAVREGKLEPLAALIKADPTLANTTNQVGQTPLRLAILTHRTNVVAFLEQHGARWDIVSAVLFGQTNALREILARQPNAIAVKNYGSPLLQLAAANGDVTTTKILLAAGCDVRVQDYRGLSALGTSELNNHPTVAELLRQHGATENIFDTAYNGLQEKAAELIKQNKSLALATNTFGLTVLEVAAGIGHAEVLKLLLDSGASAQSINARNGYTPLHLAAISNQTNTARLLIRKGARVNAYDRQGFTPLQLATIRGATEVAAVLLKNHADPNLITIESATNRMFRIPMMGGRLPLILPGDSALHLAVVFDQTNLVQLLLTAGAAVNATDALGRTPLDLAAADDFPPVLFMLHRYFGSMNPLGIAGPPPFLLMQSMPERQKMVEHILEQAGGKRLQKNQPFGRPSGLSWQTPNRLMRLQ